MPGLQVQGATVRLDDGRELTPSSPAEYIFPNVTSRYACVTVEKPPTYPPQTQCRQVTANGNFIYNSFHLKTNPPPQDPVPSGVQPVTGTPCEDPTGDATVVPPDEPGCGCESGDLRGSRVLLVALVAFMLTRRRGTKA
jgi:hypothetical protein